MEDAHPPAASPTPSKKLKSQPPDVHVTVGTGDAAETFECYKVLLSFASPVFDGMFSSEMTEGCASDGGVHRVSFPTKDPKEWKLFYPFCEPSAARVGSGNLNILLPWFHEFQMDVRLNECDNYLASNNRKVYYQENNCNQESMSVTWIKRTDVQRTAAIQKIFDLMQLADRYNLKKAKGRFEKMVGFLFSQNMIKQITNLEDLMGKNNLRCAVEKVLPLERCSIEPDTVGIKGENNPIWNSLKLLVEPHVLHLSESVLEDATMLSHLISIYMKNKRAEHLTTFVLSLETKPQLVTLQNRLERGSIPLY